MATKKEPAKVETQPTSAEVKKVITMRKKGIAWLEIMAKLGKPRQFVIEVRPLMKAIDRSLVKPSYDRAKRSALKMSKSGSKVMTS